MERVSERMAVNWCNVFRIFLDFSKATSLLVKLSGVSHYLVHSLVAERLNSTSWQDRVKACIIMPKLDGGLTKDIANKLSTMMWRDWHKTVRKVG